MYLFSTIILLLLSFYIISTPDLEKFRTKYSAILNLFLTFVVTFVGIFLGLYLSKMESNNTNRKQTISLLKVAKYDVDNTLESISNSIQSVQRQKSSNSTHAFYGFTRTNPFDNSYTFNRLIESNNILKDISPYSFQSFVNSKKTITKILLRLNGENDFNDNGYIYRLNILYFELSHIYNVLGYEIDYLNRKTSPNNLLKLINESRMDTVKIVKFKSINIPDDKIEGHR